MLNFATLSALNEDQARELLERIRWPAGTVCPHCGSVGEAYRTKPNPQKRVRDGLWKVQGVPQAVHRHHRNDLRAVAHSDPSVADGIRASKKGVSALQLQRQLGLGSYQSAWHMAHRIRHAMTQQHLAGLLQGYVEVDETYVGGKPRRGSGERRAPRRGTKKTAVVALVERGGRARARVVERVNGATLKAAIRENVDRKAYIMTDEWPA